MHKQTNKIGQLLFIAGLTFLSCSIKKGDSITRTELSRHNLADTSREVIQVRIDFQRNGAFGKHSHPGEEVIYVLEGLLEYEISGGKPVTLKTGNVLFIPAGVIHSARNASHTKAAELATYITQKRKPLVVMQ